MKWLKALLSKVSGFFTNRPNFLDRLPQDKLLHFFLGAITFSLTSSLGITPAIMATVILGAGIEIIQRVFKVGTYDILDAAAVWLGGATVLFAIIMHS